MTEEVGLLEQEYAVLPLRDVVVYPYMVIPLFVGRQRSIDALEASMAKDKKILLVAQISGSEEEPEIKDLFNGGTVARILQLLRLPDGTVKVLVEGVSRADIHSFNEDKSHHLRATVTVHKDIMVTGTEIDVLTSSILSQFEHYVKMNKKIPPEVLTSLAGIDDPSRLSDTVAAHMSIKVAEKQQLLDTYNVQERMEHILSIMDGALDILQVEKKIHGRVKKQMERNQREFYLNEKVKAINIELGKEDEEDSDELES